MRSAATLTLVATLTAAATLAVPTAAGAARRAYFRAANPEALARVARFGARPLAGGIVVAEVPPAMVPTLSTAPGLTFLGYEGLFQPTPIGAAESDASSAEPGVRSQVAAANRRPCWPPATDPVGWGIKAMYEDPNLVQPSGGAGIKIGIVDSGVFPHLDIVRRLVKCVSEVPSDTLSPCTDVWTTSHGTMVASVIAADGGADGLGMLGMAPEATIYSYRVCDQNRECWGAYVAAGIRQAIADGVNIINISLDGPGNDDVVHEAIQDALAHNILVVVAAANSPPYSYVGYPGAYPEVVSVGALSPNLTPWPFTASGVNDGDYIRESNEIEVAAPGDRILAATKVGCWAIVPGTSLAAPMVTGLAAKLWNGDAAATRQKIRHSAVFHDLYVAGDDTLTGFGMPTMRDDSGRLFITAGAQAGGTITPTGVVVVSPGATQTFTIDVPDPACHALQDVVVDGVSQGPIRSYTFPGVSSDHSIYATFADLALSTITASALSGGTIYPSGAVHLGCGESATFTFTPSICNSVLDVKVDGVSKGDISSYTFANVYGNHTIQAAFADGYVIHASAGSGGTISPSGPTRVPCSQLKTYTITPLQCATIADVRIDGVSVGPLTHYTFSNVRSPHTIAATFTLLGGTYYSISASAGPGGTISPSGVTTVPCGEQPVFAITPTDTCAVIQDVRVDGVSVGAVSSYTFPSVDRDHTLSAAFYFGPYTITASQNLGGTISPEGNVSVACGERPSFTITPSGCSALGDVKVDGVSKGPIPSYTFSSVRGNHSIQAEFVGRNSVIDARADQGGTISPEGPISVACGATQTFLIHALPCYSIKDVIVDGVSKGAATSFTVQTTSDLHTIVATFAPVATVTIAASAGAGGTISPSGAVAVACNGDQTFTITPADTCTVIQNVKVDGSSIGAISSYTFTGVWQSHSIEATFLTSPFTITAPSDGSVTPAGASTVPCGGTITYSIGVPGTCPVADVRVDGVSMGPVSTYTFYNVKGNHTISATFVSGGPFTLNATTGFGGAISPVGATVVSCGATRTYVITPANCYKIKNVLVDGVPQGPISTYTFTAVRANHTILSTFTPVGNLTVNAIAGEGGTITPSGASSVACGGNKSFTIAPSDNCHVIQDVKVDGASRGPIPYVLLSDVKTDRTIEAVFLALGPYTIEASAGSGGTISPGRVTGLACGSSQTYAIAPADGCHRIDDVLVDGISRGPITSYTFTSLRGSHTIEARFAEFGPYTLEADAGAGGTISPAGSAQVACGASPTYAIAPADKCHAVQDVKVDGVSQGPILEYTFPAVTGDHRIEAAFAALGPFTIRASADPGAAITPAGATEVGCGASLSYSIAPAEACRVIGDVLVDGVSVGHPSVYTFGDVQGAHTLAVTSVASGLALAETHHDANGPPDGSIDLSVSGGVAPYTYDWSNGARSEDLAGLAPGSYTVHVTDAQGCDVSLAVTIVSLAPAELTLSRPAPNPGAGPVRLRFGLPVAAAARLSVLDLRGAEVAVLARGEQPAGWFDAVWNGETSHGRAPSGIYFFRLQMGNRQLVERFALVR